MHVPTHLALSWLVGHPLPDRRDRRLVAWAGIVPDLDALSLLGGAAGFSRYHHVLTHNLLGALVATLVCGACARQRLKVAGLAFVTFHLHLLCDLIGAGRDWPIVYLWPFSKYEYFSPYGWPLASWQNMTITLVAFVLIAWIGIVRGYTFVETFLPAKADAAVVEVLRRRFAPRRLQLAGNRRVEMGYAVRVEHMIGGRTQLGVGMLHRVISAVLGGIMLLVGLMALSVCLGPDIHHPYGDPVGYLFWGAIAAGGLFMAARLLWFPFRGAKKQTPKGSPPR